MKKQNFTSFAELASSLHAGAAAGMVTSISLQPEAAVALAEILDTYEQTLLAMIEKEKE